jgi:hypothetical protein
VTIIDLFVGVLDYFRAATWRAWVVVLKAVFALPLSREELEVFRALSGREGPPARQVREAWLIFGRRAGKSIVVAVIAIYLTCVRRYQLAPGETGVFLIVSPDRRQGRVVLRYVKALMRRTPILAPLIASETSSSVTLTSGIIIEIATASQRTLRDYTVVGAVLNEAAFLPTDDSAQPDTEVLNALRPAMASVPNALLLVISSPYARRGELWRAFREHHGGESDDVLVLRGATPDLNPTIAAEVVDRAYREDPARAAAEYGAQFRTDVEGFLSREAVDAAAVPGRRAFPPVSGISYVGFLDFAGGSGQDSAALAVAHAEERGGLVVGVLDCLLECRPPFSPQTACGQFAEVLDTYDVTRATSDRWGGEFPVEAMEKLGIAVTPSARAKSDLYRELLPLVTSARVELLDDARLLAQIAGLERRVGRGGCDSIDHAPGSHDDLANASAGALLLAVESGGPWSTAEVSRVLRRGAGGGQFDRIEFYPIRELDVVAFPMWQCIRATIPPDPPCFPTSFGSSASPIADSSSG